MDKSQKNLKRNKSVFLKEDTQRLRLVRDERQVLSDGEDVFNEKDECVICLHSLKENENKRILKCKHLYHSECVYKWSIIENSCPQCREKFDFDTNNQKDFLEWMDLKLENFNKKYKDKKTRLLKLIEIVDTTIRLSKKDIICSKKIYDTMLNKVFEYENELNYSIISWFCNYITMGEKYICEYGWFRKTIKELELLNPIKN